MDLACEVEPTTTTSGNSKATPSTTSGSTAKSTTTSGITSLITKQLENVPETSEPTMREEVSQLPVPCGQY